jgi:hypothetical protein
LNVIPLPKGLCGCDDCCETLNPKVIIMRKRLLILATLVGGSTSLFAQEPAWQPAPGHLTLPLWPNGAPGTSPNRAPEVDTTTAKDNLIAGKPIIRLGNVSSPTLTLYTPRYKNTGAAMVVFPGGGYRILTIDLEGTEVCDWLNSVGITCVLVKYRVPDSGPYPKSSAALLDAQRALGIVRSHAGEWHIDPRRIGCDGRRSRTGHRPPLQVGSGGRNVPPTGRTAIRLACDPFTQPIWRVLPRLAHGSAKAGGQNHSLRYATHQLMQRIGTVAPSAHQIGNAKSAISPRNMKVIQKIFRCIGLGSGGSCFSLAPLTPPISAAPA